MQMNGTRRRKDARPAELTAAALELFAEKGFAATRLDDVAARAGVSKGTVYLYFDGKEDLFEAVVREGILPVLAQGEAMVADHRGDTATLLRAILHGWWEMVGETPLAGVPKIILSEARNFPEVARYYNENVIQRGRKLMAGVLERGVARGEFRAVDVAPTIDSLMSPLLFLVIWRSSMALCCPNSAVDPRHFIDRHLDLVLNGLFPRSA
jgi:AcrR family transcriptional regulator